MKFHEISTPLIPVSRNRYELRRGRTLTDDELVADEVDPERPGCSRTNVEEDDEGEAGEEGEAGVCRREARGVGRMRDERCAV